MAELNFQEIYYRTANCLTSDIIADFAPVCRIMGADTSTGMGVVFTAMGTRFDMEYVAKEAFMATDSYESDTRSIDDTPVTEVMRYVRSEIIAADKVPEQYQAMVERMLKNESVYGQYQKYCSGEEDADILFLMSPAAADAAQTAAAFLALAEKCDQKVFCTNEYQDCGYLKLQLGQVDAANELALTIKRKLSQYTTIVTDDSYVLDALLVLLPELEENIIFIDEWVLDHQKIIKPKSKTIVLHESGIIERLYPNRKVNYHQLFADAEIRLPERSGYDVTDSGMAGGLGLAEPENLLTISGRRMYDLMAQKHDVIITPCACEAAGLNCSEQERVLTLLEYISQ